MKKFLSVLFLFCGLASASLAQVSLDGTQYSQNFDDIDGEGLASSGTSSQLPVGWALYETGATANTTYVAGTGGSSVPHTLSYGFGGSIERAFGTLRGTSFSNFASVIGSEFQNNTDGAIEGLQISYTGEQWRSGDVGLVDRLLFYYSTDATGLDDAGATWIEVSQLHFTGPNTSGAGGIDGNTNSTAISFTISGLNIAEGANFWIRWVDEDVMPANMFASEHGLAVDDFSLTPFGGQTSVYLAPEEQTVNEGDGSTILFVAVNNPSLSQATVVDLEIVGGTGDASDVGNFVPQQVTIPAGALGVPVFIDITDDDIVEGDETVIFGISNPTGGNNAVIGTPSQATITIEDNDITPEYYRTTGSGAWSDLATWEFSADGNAPWVPASSIPSNLSGPIEIQATHVITSNGLREVDELTINGTLDRQSGNFILTNGPGTDMIINGRFIQSGATSQPQLLGTVNVNSTGIIEIRDNTNDQSIYGRSTRVTWQDGADFLWNAPSSFASGTYFPGTPQSRVPVFVIRQSAPTYGDASTLEILGRLIVPVGVTAQFGGSGVKTFRAGIQSDGTITQNSSSGILQVTGTTTFITGTGQINLNSTSGFVIAVFSTTFITADKTFTGGQLIVNGTLTLSSGAPKTLSLTHSGSGSVGISGTGTLNISSVAGHTVEIAAQNPQFPTNFIVGTGSIVNFNSAQLQNIPARNFANLVSSNTGDRVLPASGTVGISGTFTPGTNAYTVTGSTISYNGGSQNVAGFDYNNLLHAGTGTKTLSGAANLNGTLNMNAGVTFNTNGNDFVLVSTADETANIGVLPASASIVGNVISQRYMPPEFRMYRYISSPVNQPAVSQLQDDFPITGSFTGADVISGVISDPSFYFYDESFAGGIDDGYVAYPQTSNAETLVNGLGYAGFIRNTDTPTIIDLVGSPNTHDQVLPVTYTDTGDPGNDGWNLVGNPYASAIDWTNAGAWTRTNLDDAVYIRDNGNGGLYASYVNGVGANGGTGIIASGQGFWVKANAASPQLQLTEAGKSGNNSAEFFRSAPLDQLRVNLKHSGMKDEIVLYFGEDFDNEFVSSEDAYNLPNEIFDLASVTTSGDLLSINGLNTNFCQLNVPLQIRNTESGDYTIDLGGLETFTESVKIILNDEFTGEAIDLTEEGSYDFTITATEESYAPGRFSLTLDKSGVTPEITVEANMLSVNYSDGIQWFLNGNPIDGANESSITPSTSGEYSVEITNGTCLLTASIAYTVTGTEEFQSMFRVYPNPTADFVNFNIIDPSVGNVRIELIDLQGKNQIIIPEVAPGETKQLNLNSLSSGVYIISVITGDKRYIHRIIKE